MLRLAAYGTGMHRDLEAILAADEEGRRRVADARARLTRSIEAARAAADAARTAAANRRQEEIAATIRGLEEQAERRRSADRSARAERIRAHEQAAAGLIEEAAGRFAAIVLGSEREEEGR